MLNKNKITKFLPVFILLLILPYFLASKIGPSYQQALEEALKNDFGVFWHSGNSLLHGGNPYDPPGYFFNPPHFLFFIFPLLLLPFSLAVGYWLVFNIYLIGLIGWLVARMYSGPRFIWLLAYFSIPAWLVVHLGQSTLLVTLGMIGSWIAFSKKKNFLAGACLVLMSCKPHLFFLYALVLLFEAIRERRFIFFLGIFVMGAIALGFVSFWRPTILADWIASFGQHRTTTGVKGAVDLYTTSFPSNVSLWLATGEGLPIWPKILFPFLAILGVFVGAALRRIEAVRDAPWLITASLFMAPYAWYYDFTAAHILYIATVIWALRAPSRLWLLGPIGFQILCFALAGQIYMNDYWFLPLLLSAIGWATFKASQKPKLENKKALS